VSEEKTEAQNIARAPAKPGPPKYVLLLEDETALAETLTPHFESNGYRLVSVTNGVDGLKQIMARDFSAIVCDIMMPSLPGDMFYRAVERTKPYLCKRFIFISGFKGNRDIDEFIRKVGAILLWKPFKTDELMDAIKTVLQKTGG
jgi:DNA-binding response OmpR family regulator